MLARCVSIIAAAAVLVMLISAPAVAAVDPPMAIGLPGCNTSCGRVSVPYPFGIGPGRCYWPGLNLTCDYESKPPRLLLGHGSLGPLEVDDISLEQGTVRVVSHRTRLSNETLSHGPWHSQWSLGDTIGRPYILVRGANEFILTGCNVQATLVRNMSIVSGCVSFCAADMDGVDDGVLFTGTDPNICCCQTTIFVGSASYDVELKLLNELHGNLPTNVLIAEVGWFNPGMVFDGYGTYTERSSRSRVPVLLEWAVPQSHPRKDATLENRGNCPDTSARSICKSTNSKCIDQSASYSAPARGGYYLCRCNPGYRGNPFLTGGCQDIKECDQKEKYRCFGDCEELPGSFRCRCPQGTVGNYTMPGGCVRSTETNAGHRNQGLIIGLSVSSGPCILLLVLGAYLITRDLKKRKARTLRRKFFTQNRGQLLKQLVSHRTDIAERMLISLEELEKATNNFDVARRIGGGGHGTVYKGILSDLHVVAIKKSNIVVRREIDEFINEVAILSQINHRNVVKLRGCCLETEVPLLAYEFISNGTLSDHLHMEEPRSLPWKDRLRITSEIGKALAYLHSAVSVPVIHRDIKPSNILLDDSLTSKVSDFGASRYIPVEQTGTETAVQGTIGYLDPMYYYTGRLTETSDVYSFGVLLVELLTRRKPSAYRSSEGEGLVMQFVKLRAEGSLDELLDPQVVEEGGSEVKEVATLAVSCLRLQEEERPTMRQVDMALEALQAPMESVIGDSVQERNDEKFVAADYTSTIHQARRRETTRCHSLEEEYLLSARYPR